MTSLRITTTDVTGANEATTSGSLLIDTTSVPAPTSVTVSESGIQGGPGPVGPQGPAGPTGADGAGHDAVVFTQDIPAVEWTIPHPFTEWPSVTVADHLGDEIAVEVAFAPGVVTIRTAYPSTGRAYLI